MADGCRTILAALKPLRPLFRRSKKREGATEGVRVWLLVSGRSQVARFHGRPSGKEDQPQALFPVCRTSPPLPPRSADGHRTALTCAPNVDPWARLPGAGRCLLRSRITTRRSFAQQEIGCAREEGKTSVLRRGSGRVGGALALQWRRTGRRTQQQGMRGGTRHSAAGQGGENKNCLVAIAEQ
jgi:hypothetical protein